MKKSVTGGVAGAFGWVCAFGAITKKNKHHETMKKLILLAGLACIGVAGIAADTGAVSGSSAAAASPAQVEGLPGAPVRTIVGEIIRDALNFHHDMPLSDSQKQQVAAILRNHQAEIHDQIENAVAARRAMRQAVESSGPDSQAARDAAAKIGDAARDGALLRAKIGTEIKPILTPEQLARIQAGTQDIDATVDKALAQ